MKRVAVLLAVLAGCASDGGDNTVPDMAVIDAWTRPTPPGITDAAIYVSISNETAPDDHIAGMTSERCAAIVPHRTVIDDAGVASMPGILGDELALPTNGQVVMEPNGLHLMCLGLAEPLEAGDEFDLEFTFDTHEPLEATVTVR